MDFPSETLDFYGLSMFLGAYPFFLKNIQRFPA